MPRTAKYARLRSSGRCPQCGSPVTDYKGNGGRYVYCTGCGAARVEQRAAKSQEARREPESPGPRQRGVPPRLRRAVAERHRWRCQSCGVELSPAGRWHVDHRVPVARSGSHDLEHLAVACTLDNLRNGDLTEPEYRDWLPGYGSDLPDFDERTWAAVAAVRALVRKAVAECPAAAGVHAPCDTCRAQAIAVLAELHASEFSTKCRRLAATSMTAPTFSPLGRAEGCRWCNIVCDAIWRAFRLSEGVSLPVRDRRRALQWLAASAGGYGGRALPG